MKFRIVLTSRFKKDLKIIARSGYDLSLIENVVNTLSSGKTLPKNMHDHSLSGNYKNCRECHITPDWLLIYETENNELILYLTRTGTHSDLFKY